MGWMEVYLDMYLGRLRTSITKLCAVFGIAHLSDEVCSEVLLLICTKASSYDPARSSFVTWVMNYAKGVVHRMVEPASHARYGGDRINGVHMAYEYMFAESEPLLLTEEGDVIFAGTAPSPEQLFIDGENAAESLTRVKAFLDSLDESEMTCLRLLMSDGRVRYRQLGAELGVSHVHAGRLLPGIMSGLRSKASRLQE